MCVCVWGGGGVDQETKGAKEAALRGGVRGAKNETL